MYTQPPFEETRPSVLYEAVRSHPLATFIVQQEGDIVVNHFPLLLAAPDDSSAVLRGHIPKSNTIWKHFAEQEAVAVFQGPDSYVSPSWYPSKSKHGKVVPTWNYVVVHARGCPVAMHDPGWLLAHLNDMTDEQEASQEHPWSVSDAPRDFIHQMVDRLVGIEMPISSIAGKWKVSQNRSSEDRSGVAAALGSKACSTSLDMKHLVLKSAGDPKLVG